jgi:hypothetical protein
MNDLSTRVSMEDNNIPLDFLWEGLLKVMQLTLSTLRVAKLLLESGFNVTEFRWARGRSLCRRAATWLGRAEVFENAVTPHRKLSFKKDLQ